MEYKDFITIICEVKNENGLHARPAAKLCEICNSYDKNITVKYEDIEADGKSVIQILTLCAVKGSKLEIIIEGNDDKAKAIGNKIYKAFELKFKK